MLILKEKMMTDKITHVIVKTDVVDLTFTRTQVTDSSYIDRCTLDFEASTYPYYLSIIQESHRAPDIYELAVIDPLTGNLMYNHPLAVHLQDITNSADDEVVFPMKLDDLNKVLANCRIDANILHIMHVKKPLFEKVKEALFDTDATRLIDRINESGNETRSAAKWNN